MKVFYADHTALPLPEGHRFPSQKYPLLMKRVAEAGFISEAELIASQPAGLEQIQLAHTPDYVHRVVSGLLTEKETRRIGFPWSSLLVERARRSIGGTLEASRTALQEGIAANLAGGTHHAYPDHGEGYCVFNDVAIAARVMQAEGRVKRVVVIDCDVHQGNGTAAIFAGDRSVFTFSIHGQKNFPFHKEQSSLDIALPDRSDDQLFLAALQWGLDQSLKWSRADLAIYIAGADPFVGDQLGRMAVSKEGLIRRDELVLAACQAIHLPVVIVMGGGYARNIEDTVDIQFNTIRLAAQWLIGKRSRAVDS